MVKILREADRSPVAEVAKNHGISDQTTYGWRQRFGQLAPEDVRRLRRLEKKSACSQKLEAEHDLKLDVMREVNQRNVSVSNADRHVGSTTLGAGLAAEIEGCDLLAVMPEFCADREPCFAVGFALCWR